MEIKLNAGDRFTIPTGCKATIKDNFIVIEEQKEEFKEGDILHSIYDSIMIIFKAFGKTGEMSSHYDNDRLNISESWLVASFRRATEEEKQSFFYDLKKEGLRWNAETKKMERIRQRAEKGKEYLIVNRLGDVVKLVDEHSTFDDMNNNSGNYYLLSESEQAEEDAKAVRAIYEKRVKV